VQKIGKELGTHRSILLIMGKGGGGGEVTLARRKTVPNRDAKEERSSAIWLSLEKKKKERGEMW